MYTYKNLSINGKSKMLSDKQQEILLNFLFNVLKDTKSISVRCDCSHVDEYYQLVELMSDLHIFSIKEDYNINNPSVWSVQVDFLYPLRNLLSIEVQNE